jgi:hypothetical protein
VQGEMVNHASKFTWRVSLDRVAQVFNLRLSMG